ncbi:MAG: hypothetical protein N5P05_000921 [Chroococcopsis gigantea SAG 12.99]|jgi:hypothetical protein|nr:hypothetical protein [Chlorogloea purpurea SAG 13.99]MDV2999315.1 hypothetical protein [Chroococcopsis gigantea SAG 12.99]
MNTIVNDLLLPVFLFLVYLCAFSLFIYKPEIWTKEETTSSSSEQSTVNPENVGHQPPQSKTQTMLTIEQDEEVPAELPIANEQPEEIIESQPDVGEDRLYIETETIIHKLNKRQTRKICQPLGIKQKSGKSEKSLMSIRTEIEQRFKEQPLQVIGVIRLRLPELLSS